MAAWRSGNRSGSDLLFYELISVTKSLKISDWADRIRVAPDRKFLNGIEQRCTDCTLNGLRKIVCLSTIHCYIRFLNQGPVVAARHEWCDD